MQKIFLSKIIAISFIIAFAISFSAVGVSFAYFDDTENSAENVLTADTLDFSVPASSDFSPAILGKGETSGRVVTLQNDGNLNFQYKVSFERISGELCNSLNLTAGSYSGPLKDFINQESFKFTDKSSWNFNIELPIDASDSLQGEVCHFKFVFNGWQENLPEGQGFSDTEEIENTISAKYWNPPVVLNEILPNPPGDECSLTGLSGEWVEIYNKTSNSIDLSGWSIKDAANNQIAIQTSNTLNGSTTIGVNNWLVVFLNSCILDNTGDTVTLYNQNGVQVDSYAYSAPHYNVDDTPGSTNNMVLYLPFDNDLLDKSGNNNNGTNCGGATVVDGKFNKALSFDGSNDYVYISSPQNMPTSAITITAWIKLSSYAQWASIVDRYGGEGLDSFSLGLDRTYGKKLMFQWNNPIDGYFPNTVTANSDLLLYQWLYVAVSSTGSQATFYVNGVANGTGNVGPVANTGPVIIGANFAGGDEYFRGAIDEVKIYNRALSAAEIQSQYGQVLENKSYARIPDGSSNWVDPIPTPGGPNQLETDSPAILLPDNDNQQPAAVSPDDLALNKFIDLSLDALQQNQTDDGNDAGEPSLLDESQTDSQTGQADNPTNQTDPIDNQIVSQSDGNETLDNQIISEKDIPEEAIDNLPAPSEDPPAPPDLPNTNNQINDDGASNPPEGNVAAEAPIL